MPSGPTHDPGPEDGTPVATEGPGPASPAATDPSTEPAQAQSDAALDQPEGGTSRSKRRDGHRGVLSFLSELPILLLVAFLLALLIKTFLIQAFYIPSESMEHTLNVGDRVLVNKVVYHLHPPRRGDIIVFADPHPGAHPDRSAVSAFWHWLTEGFGVSTSPEKDFIKRVIGLPGETVEGKDGKVYIDGVPLEEPYVASPDLRPFPPVTVPRDSLFVMGDNRNNSNDSRFGLGMIPYDKVIGRAFVVIWPPSRVGWLHGL